MHKIVTPISHLFKDRLQAEEIILNSDYLECRDHSIYTEVLMQTVFHCELQPCHKLEESDFVYLEKIQKEKSNLELVSFHLASSCHSPILVDGVFQPNGYNYSKIELLQNAKINFKRIKKIFGKNVFLAIENNNFYPTLAYHYITEPSFISELVISNEINFLFDIAHAKISAFNKGLTYEEYKKDLPLSKTIQLHICKSAIKNQLAYDAHFMPDDYEWSEVVSLLEAYVNIKYLTIEYYHDFNGLIISLKKLKKILLNNA